MNVVQPQPVSVMKGTRKPFYLVSIDMDHKALSVSAYLLEEAEKESSAHRVYHL